MNMIFANIPNGKEGFYTHFFSLEKRYINFVSKSVRRPSVCLPVRPCVRPSVTFLVNVSPPKP